MEIKKTCTCKNLLLLYVDEEILASGALLVISGNGMGMLPMESDTINDINHKEAHQFNVKFWAAA